MGETRHRTVLEVGVDDRGLRQLAPAMERALSPQVAEAFEKSLERSSNVLGKMVEHQTKLAKLLDAMHRKQAVRAREDEQQGRKDEKRIQELEKRLERATRKGSFRGSLAGHALTGAYGASQRGAHAFGSMAGEGFLPGMLGGIPFVGPAFGAAMGGIMGLYQSYAAQQIARSRAFGTTGLIGGQFGAFQGTGVSYGLGPAESAGFLGQLGSASGLRGSELAGAAPRALALQSLLGIDAGASGGFLSGQLTAGGDPDRALRLLTEAVQEGMSAGIREGRLGEMIAQVGQLVGQMRTQGVRIDSADVLGLVRGLGTLGGGFHGEAAGAAARSITQGMSGAADRSGLISAMAIRSRMSEHGEDYETAARYIESHPAEMFRSVMGTLSQFRGTRGYETMLRTQFGNLGIQLSRQQAHDLAISGTEDFDWMAPSEPGASEEGIGAVLHERRRTARRAGMGTASAEAAHEAQRASIGSGYGGTVQRYRALEMDVIRELAPHVNSFVRHVLDEVQGLFDAYQRGGVGGLLSHAMGRVFDVGHDAAEASYNWMDELATRIASSLDDAIASLLEALGFNDAAARRRGHGQWLMQDLQQRQQQSEQGSGGQGSPAGASSPNGPHASVEIIVHDRTTGGIEVARG